MVSCSFGGIAAAPQDLVFLEPLKCDGFATARWLNEELLVAHVPQEEVAAVQKNLNGRNVKALLSRTRDVLAADLCCSPTTARIIQNNLDCIVKNLKPDELYDTYWASSPDSGLGSPGSDAAAGEFSYYSDDYEHTLTELEPPRYGTALCPDGPRDVAQMEVPTVLASFQGVHLHELRVAVGGDHQERSSGAADCAADCAATALPAPTPPPKVRLGGRRRKLPGEKAGPRRMKAAGGGAQRPKGRLWQFLVEMLEDPKCNPSLIRWVDRREGVFAFVQNKVVAQRWGAHKGNPDMTYEKMSRTIRTYTNEAFAKHDTRLHYKFGNNAIWRKSANGA